MATTTTKPTSGNVITQLIQGAITDWNDAENWIDTQVAKINAVLPGASAVETSLVSDVKQGASDIVGAIGNGTLQPAESAMVVGVDALMDTAMDAASGGAATPFNQVTNAFVNGLVAKGYAALQAWALKAQAALAEQVATNMTADSVSADTPAVGLPTAGVFVHHT